MIAMIWKIIDFFSLPIIAAMRFTETNLLKRFIVIVISPLKSLMNDQITYLNNLSIPAIS